MIRFLKHAADRRPPPRALVVVAALLALVPVYQCALVAVRNWAEGGSPAAALDAPFFWAVIWLRALGSVALAGLLWLVRRPAAIWVTIVACWLSGPPITFLLGGILMLSASAGQRAMPGNWEFLGWSFLFPALVTACLLLPKPVRLHYGIQRPVNAPRSS